MPSLKRILVLVYLFTAILIGGMNPQSSVAQFIPCKIVNLNLTLPDIVQAGQPFQITTTLTVSCDQSILPVVRVDLVDATTSQILTTTSNPYYPSSSSFTVSVVSRATARPASGSWPLEIRAYVLSGINGATAASSSQLFQLNVVPYTPPVTTMQTIETTTQVSSISSAVSYSFPTLTTIQGNQTQALQTSQITSNTSTTPDLTGQLLPAATLILVALAIFVLLFYAGGKRARKSIAGGKYCGQCGSEIEGNPSFCTNCGAKQTKRK